MPVYYNEIDAKKAAWLRELMLCGLIAPGDVDERSIADVRPDDLRGYTQCHFFAGIGIWSYALRLAGWPDDREVWTGSCPCQPFSAAGKGEAFDDERHLWPIWFPLIETRRPLVCFGEQVASIDGLAWLDLVQSDLDDADYTCGANDLCAAGFAAPHRRQHIYWVAHTESSGHQGQSLRAGRIMSPDGTEEKRFSSGVADSTMQRRQYQPGISGVCGTMASAGEERVTVSGDGDTGILADNQSNRRRKGATDGSRFSGRDSTEGSLGRTAEYCATRGVEDADCLHAEQSQGIGSGAIHSGSRWPGGERSGSSEARGMEDALRSERWPNQREHGGPRETSGRDESPERVGEPSKTEWLDDASANGRKHGPTLTGSDGAGDESSRCGIESGDRGPVNGFWRGADWVLTRPQRVGDRPGLRPVERRSFPLAHGTPARVGRLRGYGDGIVAEAAKAFIEAYVSLNG